MILELEVTVGGLNISNLFISTNVERSIGNMFNSATIIIPTNEVYAIIGAEVYIKEGDTEFFGFIYSKTTQDENTDALQCRSNGARLAEPFSISTEVSEGVSTARGLCYKYSKKYGVPITYKSVDIDFLAPFNRTGTAQSALFTVVNILGADIYDDGAGIIIEPKKKIGDAFIEVTDNMLIGHPIVHPTMQNSRLGRVIVTNPDITNLSSPRKTQINDVDITHPPIDIPIDLSSLRFIDPLTGLVRVPDPTILPIAGEGVWTVTGGEIKFTPSVGFTDNATPVQYEAHDKDGNYLGRFWATTDYDGDTDGGDILTYDSLNYNINYNTGLVSIYSAPPVDRFDHSVGLEGITVRKISKIESGYLDRNTSFTTVGAIEGINGITVNGVNIIGIAAFAKDTNTIIFSTPQIGVLKVDYKTTEITAGITALYSNADGTYGHFQANVGNERVSWTGKLSARYTRKKDDLADDTLNSRVVGKSILYSHDGLPNYVKGFTLKTYGDASRQPLLQLYDGINQTTSVGKITSIPMSVVDIAEGVKLNATELGGYATYLKYEINTVTDVVSAGVSIAYTTPNDENGKKYVELSTFHPNVEVLYTTNAIVHIIKYPKVTADQTLMLLPIGAGDGIVPIEIALTDDDDEDEDNEDDNENIPCSYPADYVFNIASLLSMNISDVKGKTIAGMGTVDGWGKVTRTITTDGIYTYDTSDIKMRTSITLKANVNGSLTND